jgi:hypothetical protein
MDRNLMQPYSRLLNPELSLRVFLRNLIFFLIGIAPLFSFGQQGEKRKGPRIGSSVLDDSTRNVYGPNTTKWITEEDIFFNRKNNYHTVDTSVLNYHRWTYVSKLNNFYKDLGNMGTSLMPIFPQLRPQIGVTSGYTSYEQYFLQNTPKYYDTKSPYTRIYIVWGGNGRATTAAEFSRNINPRWNFGFSYRPILVDKQIQRARKGDRHVISQYYDIYTGYKTKDEKYSAYFNFQRMKHRVKENGGVSESGSQSLSRGIFDPNASPLLTKAESMELRTNFHLFHEYKVGKALQLYHIFDRSKQRNGFSDRATDSAYFDHQEYKRDTVFDRTQIKTVQNEMGIKGNVSRLFYDFYYKIRKFDLQNNRLQNNYSYATQQYDSGVIYSGYENYLGGRISLELDSVTRLTGWAEYMLDGNYRIEGNLNTPWLDASLKNLQAKPTFIQNYYRGSHDLWKNFFSNTNSTQATGFLKGKFGQLFISPGFTYTLLSNYIFMKEDYLAKSQKAKFIQSSGLQQVVSPEVRLQFSLWKKIFLRPNVIYTRLLQNADSALSIPKLFVNTQLSFESHLFKKNIFAQIGFDYHWQSSYYGMAYDVPTQQFYIQNKQLTKAYPLVDVFVNGQFSRGKFFIRYHNLIQLFTTNNQGYIITPGYPGLRNILDFGFELILFD